MKMNKKFKILLIFSVLILGIAYACNKKNNEPNSDTILEGKTEVLVDETLLPIVEDQAIVFESQYKAKLTLIPKSEKECVIAFSKQEARVIILSRELNREENSIFRQKKIIPKTTPFAIDAIAFIKNKKSNDTLIVLKQVLDYLKGSKNGIKGLVFDNPNSSSVRYLCQLAGIKSLPDEGVFSFNTNDEVIKHIAQNESLIGIVGLNWLSQPKAAMKQFVDNVAILSVKDTGKDYIYPSQETIGTREYPLARVLYIINCQGYDGLGMGFASFIAGEIGQRIILQSGLAPIREPSRDVIIRNQIETKK
jgi:phosphate transport system substrate-binding protein